MSPRAGQQESWQGGPPRPPARRRWASTGNELQGALLGGGLESTASGMPGVPRDGGLGSTVSGMQRRCPPAALWECCYGQQHGALGKPRENTCRGLPRHSGAGRTRWPPGHREAGWWERERSRKRRVRWRHQALKGELEVAWDYQWCGLLESTWSRTAEQT